MRKTITQRSDQAHFPISGQACFRPARIGLPRDTMTSTADRQGEMNYESLPLSSSKIRF